MSFLLLSLLAACDGEIPSPSDIPSPDEVPSPIEVKERIREKAAENRSVADEKPSAKKAENPGKGSAYDLVKLQEDINNITANSYRFKADPSNAGYIRSNELKYYVIRVPSNKDDFAYNSAEFCDEYCAENWDGWKYYQNMSYYRWLIPVLTRENFSNDYQYNEYKSEITWVEEIVSEKVYDVENGKVLEYEYILWSKDNFNYFLGAWADTLLLYKVYCSPNMTVFLRPKWNNIRISWDNMKIDDVLKSWDSYLDPFRKELLQQSNEMLKRCGVSKEFFNDANFPEYRKAQTLTFHWRPYYRFYANLTRSMSLGALQKRDHYEVSQINISITNNEFFDFEEDLDFRITVIPDSKLPIEYYEGKAGTGLAPGKSIVKRIKGKDVEFDKNITVEVELYTVEDKGLIRPFSQTFVFEPLS